MGGMVDADERDVDVTFVEAAASGGDVVACRSLRRSPFSQGCLVECSGAAERCFRTAYFALAAVNFLRQACETYTSATNTRISISGPTTPDTACRR
jgi:hypothetical protein